MRAARPAVTEGAVLRDLHLPGSKAMVGGLHLQYSGELEAEAADHQAITPRNLALLASSRFVHPTIRYEPEPHYLYNLLN